MRSIALPIALVSVACTSEPAGERIAHLDESVLGFIARGDALYARSPGGGIYPIAASLFSSLATDDDGLLIAAADPFTGAGVSVSG